MNGIAWAAVALVAGTIALEIWIANKKLNADLAALELWVREEGDDD